jgi:hypothetical protein
LKACGLFTAAAEKRNPYVETGRNSVATASYCAISSLIRQPVAAAFVAPAQFVHQMLEMGRQARGFRAKVLLQPFGHGVADRSAGLAIDQFAVVGNSAVHDEFRFLAISFNEVTPDQVTERELVSSRGSIPRLFGKIRMKICEPLDVRIRQKAPVAQGPGPF